MTNCSFMNKRLALDILEVQVIATREAINVRMAVPLEFTTIERKHEYVLPAGRRRKG